MLYAIAVVSEVGARIARKPALLSLAAVRLMRKEEDRSHYSVAKSERELGVRFRPVEETLADTIAWYRANGELSPTLPSMRQRLVDV